MPEPIEANLKSILDKIVAGNNLNAHLSRRVTSGFVLPKPGNQVPGLHKRSDLDLLINDWGIHHLHLSDVIESDGFMQRGDPLLFAISTPDYANVLDLYLEHGNWSDHHLVQVAVGNWPAALLFVELKGALNLRQPIRAADRKQLRQAGMDVPIEVDGKVFRPATGGLSAAGISTKAAMRAQSLLRNLVDLQEKTSGEAGYIVVRFREFGLELPREPCFDLVFLNTTSEFRFAVMERHSGHILLMPD